jgi:beta-lactamase regulating signal transducer with metallopeptidase domain
MNSIEHLNQLGGQFLTFAWPMFWQSSLLIGLVYAIDRLLARKVRAAVRHGLWVVVLLKLLLPPSLALPTGAAWWLFRAEPAVQAPAPRNFVVTVGDAPAAENFMPVSVPLVTPPAKLNGAGWALLATAAVSVGLMGWLLFRGGQVARMVRRAAPADELEHLLGQVRRAAGLRRPLRLRMVEDRTSPAVAGLLRPVILLPRVVAERLSAEQLRAVLLHEAMHLRRCDLWTNCAQALLQSLYWWHPLVWLANARLRRLREEAVDDAVMLALADGAEIYAPTLLEVARLAFRRPLLSLGLVGILESRSALRQRIERLVAFRAPRRAGLSLVSLLAILGFSAVALPMGQGPAPAIAQPLAAIPQAATDATPGQPFPRPMVLIQAEIYQVPPGELNRLVSDLPTVKEPGHGANNIPAGEETWWSASPAQYLELSGRLEASGLKPEQRPRILTSSGKPAQFFVGDTLGRTEILDGTEIDCLPVVRDGKIQLNFTSEAIDATAGARLTNRVEGDWELPSHGGLVVPMPNDAKHRVFFLTAEVLTNALQAQSPPGSSSATDSEARDRTAEKLRQIRLPSISLDKLTLDEVARRLTEQSKSLDPEEAGIEFRARPMLSPPITTTQTDPESGMPVEGTTSGPTDVSDVAITVDPQLLNSNLEAVLDAVVKGASRPIHYAIADGSVIFLPGGQSTKLFTRTFRVASEPFWSNLRRQPGLAFDVQATNSASVTLRKLFGAAGVDWDMPPGKAVFYNDQRGILFVKATAGDLDLIERVVTLLVQPASLNGGAAGDGKNDPPTPAPEVHIKARFIELPADAVGGMKWLVASTNLSDGGITALLTSENAHAVLQALQKCKGMEVLGEPEVTMLSGRHVQMRATTIQSIVTNIVFHDISTNGNGVISNAKVEPQTERLETGPILDAVPLVLDDDYTIVLTMTASVTEFLGNASPTNAVGHPLYNSVTNAAGLRVDLPVVLPGVQYLFSSSQVSLRDNQTVVLWLNEAQMHQMGSKSQGTWADALVAQYIKQAEKKKGSTEVLVFVTATLIDPAGNHIHSDDDLLLAPGAFPPQPAGPK